MKYKTLDAMMADKTLNIDLQTSAMREHNKTEYTTLKQKVTEMNKIISRHYKVSSDVDW